MASSRRAAIGWRTCSARAGLHRLDHYAIFMENNAHYVECCSAGARTGVYYTCVNSFLTPEELAYILNNSESRILITSEAKRGVAAAALKSCPKIELCLIVDGKGDGERVQNLEEATAAYPATPVADECARNRACSILPAPPAGRKESCGRCRSSRRRSNSRFTPFWKSSGAIAKA